MVSPREKIQNQKDHLPLLPCSCFLAALERLLTSPPNAPAAGAPCEGAGEAGAGEPRFGGFDTPAPNPASTLFIAVALGGAAVALGEAGKPSEDLSAILRV